MLARIIILLSISILLFLNACSKVRESAGVTRKSIDEFQAVENPPLVIPPDFNLISPDKLENKNLANIEKDLAEEILFGLDEETLNNNNIDNSSTINAILDLSLANKVSDNIRIEIDESFNQEKNTKKIFKSTWNDEQEVLDAIEESRRLRENKFEGESFTSGEVPILEEDLIKDKRNKKKKKKKKRFWFF